MTKITKTELIEHLNKDLELEYAAAVQYIQHAAVLTGPEYKSIAAELNLHATEELTHAQMIAEQIDFLGGVPTIDVENRFTAADIEKMLRFDLAGEQLAINRYKARIQEARELEEYGLARVVEDILIQEEEHKRDIKNALGI